MLERLKRIDRIAEGNIDIFMKEFEDLKDYIIKHPELLGKSGW
jgi:Fe-S oxidoreductase